MLMGDGCSCVLLNDESELHSGCSTKPFPNVFERLNSMRMQKEGCDVFFAVGEEQRVGVVFGRFYSLSMAEKRLFFEI